ncbi:MAG: tetratricopeptide repeat protein [Alphaproteobacteria bacterium]|nr:tetratricopeptide repeat protein [Alphaproteobacteria bacterium]
MTDRRRYGPRARALCTAALLCAALPLAGCQTLGDSGAETADAAVSEPAQLRREGVKALRENRLKEASTYFNAALKLDVQNPSTQFLNGLAYHMQAVTSDRSLFPLAHQGYSLAIQFDPTSWIARYHLGLLHLDKREYAQAKTAFADALLYNDRDPDLLYNLAAAAYYAHDPQTAEAALTRLREIEPDSARTLRASAVVLAALGNPAEARRFLDRYRAQETDARTEARIARRVEDWDKVHARVQTASFRVPAPPGVSGRGAKPAQFPGSSPFPGAEPFPGSPPQPDAAPAPEPVDTPVPSTAGSETVAVDDPANRMVIVDVVIIASQEDISTAKGVNLLSGLTLQFGIPGDPTLPAFSRTSTRTSDDLSKGTAESSTAIIKRMSIAGVSYSLNIANAGAARNEILARPTLVALAGQRSEFFSGENIKASSVSTTAQQGATDVEKDIGVKLAVTPEFLAGGRIKLLVETERTFLQTPSSSVDFDFQLRTSKTTVSANVVLNAGESLILSGLSEKETENIRDGVPGLQDIPLIQYLFSRQSTRDFNKSVLVLITPRIPEYIYRPGEARGDAAGGGDQVLDELKARFSDWFRPYPNWASVFRHLQNNSLYREFRTGDVALESWDAQTSRKARFKKALGFLYF